MDPLLTTVLAMFGSAIAALFGALLYSLRQQVKDAKTEITSCLSEKTLVEEENKEYVALFVMLQGQDHHELKQARARVAAILRRQRGYTS